MKVKNKEVYYLRCGDNAAPFNEVNEYITIPFPASELKIKNIVFIDNGSAHLDHVVYCTTSLPIAFNSELFHFFIDANKDSNMYLDQSFQIKNNSGSQNLPINNMYRFSFLSAIDGSLASLQGRFLINMEFTEYEKE